MALTVPNIDANAGKAASNASTITIAIDRFDILIPHGTSTQVPFSLQLVDKPACRSRKACQGMRKKPENTCVRLQQSFEAEMAG
jgi:hypothetical protein